MCDESESLRCPFVYATGKQCTGKIVEARVYGPLIDGKVEPRKYRFFCSDGWDHQGAVSSHETKERMEFYPRELPEKTIVALKTAGLI